MICFANGFLLFLMLLCTGTDAILLGAETLRGIYPVETISTVGRICAEVNLYCFDHLGICFIPFTFLIVGEQIVKMLECHVIYPGDWLWDLLLC